MYLVKPLVSLERLLTVCEYAIESCHLEVFCKIGVLSNSDFSKMFEKYMLWSYKRELIHNYFFKDFSNSFVEPVSYRPLLVSALFFFMKDKFFIIFSNLLHVLED